MKTTYKILLVLLVGIGAVAALYLIQPKPVKNGFNRGKTYTATKLDALELKYNYWHISQLSYNRIYLGNYKAVLAQFSCGYNLQDTIYEKVPFDGKKQKLLDLVKQRIVQKTDPKGNSFSTDGFISLNEAKERLLYTYYYRNSFMCLDAGLNVLYTAKMIDTNTVAKIELGEYKAGKQHIRTLAKPALAVNKRGYSDGNWFYNHTALAADNEKREEFNRHEVFDVYRLDNGRYSHSIYLPKYKDKKLTDVALQGNLLIALYEKYMVTYLMK